MKDKIIQITVDTFKSPSIKYGLSENGNLYKLKISEDLETVLDWELVCLSPDKRDRPRKMPG